MPSTALPAAPVARMREPLNAVLELAGRRIRSASGDPAGRSGVA